MTCQGTKADWDAWVAKSATPTHYLAIIEREKRREAASLLEDGYEGAAETLLRHAEALAEAQRVLAQHAEMRDGLDYIIGWSVQGKAEAQAKGGQHPTGGAKFSMSPSTFKELKQLRDQVLAALTPAISQE